MKATIRTEVTGELLEAGPERPLGPPPTQPAERKPFFQVGEASGKPGDIVEVPVYGGCLEKIDGFHIGGGVGKTEEERSGYQKFQAQSAALSPYLADYLAGQDPFLKFQFMDWNENKALPEEWWEYSCLFFSIASRVTIPPVMIPSGVELFRVKIRILPTTPAREYELTCKDEHYYTNAVQRRRDWTYTFAPQGYTEVECIGGKLTVIE